MKKLLLFFLVILFGGLLLLVSCGESECSHENGVRSVVDPTCEKGGYTLFQCNDCDYFKKTNATPPLGHDLQVNVVPPDCDSEGYTHQQCANCSLQYNTDILPPKGHTFHTTVTPPTCTKEGYTVYQCVDCSFNYKSDTVAPKGHAFVATVTAPTCTQQGSTLYACDCGFSYISDVKAPLGHTYQTQVIAPTCTNAGYTLYTCTACPHSIKGDHTDPLGHDIEERTLEPTCEQAGYTQHSCKRCAYTYRAKYLSPLGHSFTPSIQHPTRTAAGCLTESCACGYEILHPLFYSDIFTGAFAEQDTPLAKGIDLSVYQHISVAGEWKPLNWEAVKAAGFEFAILKAGSTPRLSANGEPLGGIDPVFEMNYRDAKSNGIHVGAYFYTYALTPEEALADANRVVSWLKGKQFEYPIYFDLEDPTQEALDKDTLTNICTAFISVLQENGYYAALYTNNDWLINRLHGDVLKPLYDIWYARPPLATDTPVSANDVFVWNSEKYGQTMGMWQYTHHGVIDGIENIEFDFNYVYRDYPSIIKKYGYNGFFLEP